MKLLSALALTLALGLSVVAVDAEAKRIGSSRSVGMQRQSTPTAPAASPNQSISNPAAAGAAGAAAQPKRSWMGPIAGLAAGLGLAALASHLGFGEGLANMLMIGLLVMAGVFVFRLLMSKRQGAASSSSLSPSYAGAGVGTGADAGSATSRSTDAAWSPERQSPWAARNAEPNALSNAPSGSMIGAGLGAAATGAATIPADFDTAGFVRNAKVQFIRLQAANDAGDAEDIRRFTTPEMFAELRMDISDRRGAAQQTEVIDLEAEVLEVVEEGQRYIVSVRFTGRIREDETSGVQPFSEIWHLEKPRAGSGGWLLAGIQQVA